MRRERRNDPRIVGRLEHPSDERVLAKPIRRLVGAQEAFIVLFGGLLRCEHGEAAEDQRAYMRAVSLRLLLTSRALPRQCLVGAGLKRAAAP
jgi:hypothetical protein